MGKLKICDTIIVGVGIVGLSAATCLGRARRSPLVIDSGKSMAVWEPGVQHYMGFSKGISGEEFPERGRQQARLCRVRFASDKVIKARKRKPCFVLRGRMRNYPAASVLLATGIFHIPPDINRVHACLGHTMFFCKDCDGTPVLGKRIAIFGSNDEAVDYALGKLLFSSHVAIVTGGHASHWCKARARWIREYQIPVHPRRIERDICRGCEIRSLKFAPGTDLPVEALFTTRGDVYHNKLAKMLGARITGREVVVDCGVIEKGSNHEKISSRHHSADFGWVVHGVPVFQFRKSEQSRDRKEGAGGSFLGTGGNARLAKLPRGHGAIGSGDQRTRARTHRKSRETSRGGHRR